MNIQDILLKHEGTTLEFKANVKSEDKIIETLIAFANTSGGQLFIGIEDKNRYVVGVEDPHKVADALANKIHDTITPRILANIEVIPYRNVYVISVEVYPSPLKPHFIKSKGKDASVYLRIGATTRLADQALLNVIERSAIPQAFDEELCPDANCEDIDFTVASQLFEPKKILQENDFITLGILKKNSFVFGPTVGGILLFGKNRRALFPDAWIQAGVFAGLDKTTILDTQNITTYLPHAVEEALKFIRKNLRVGLEINSLSHQEVWEIPKVALREAIINAVVHTDYSLGSTIKISIFDDRVEIENSALLPWGLTLEDIKTGISKLRNPVIARVFHELGFIEGWGSGIQRMIKVCEQEGLERPHFEEIGPRIRVTFYKHKSGTVMFDDLNRYILDLLLFCGPLSTHDMTPLVNISRRALISRLSSLAESGKITVLAHGPNDPQKKYSLTGLRGKEHKMKMIKHMIWDEMPMQLLVRFEIGKECLDLVFRYETIEDYFLNEGSIKDNRKHAEAKLEDVMCSDSIFGNILENALSNEDVKRSFNLKEIPKYIVSPDHFQRKDYR